MDEQTKKALDLELDDLIEAICELFDTRGFITLRTDMKYKHGRLHFQYTDATERPRTVVEFRPSIVNEGEPFTVRLYESLQKPSQVLTFRQGPWIEHVELMGREAMKDIEIRLQRKQKKSAEDFKTRFDNTDI